MSEFTANQDISIHSPHARGDTCLKSLIYMVNDFNPLPSCEGRRYGCAVCLFCKRISIHSPHARGDRMDEGREGIRNHFNPLPSCEGRHLLQEFFKRHIDFNPLPSCEGRQHKPLKIRLDSRQFIQQNHHSSFF